MKSKREGSSSPATWRSARCRNSRGSSPTRRPSSVTDSVLSIPSHLAWLTNGERASHGRLTEPSTYSYEPQPPLRAPLTSSSHHKPVLMGPGQARQVLQWQNLPRPSGIRDRPPLVDGSWIWNRSSVDHLLRLGLRMLPRTSTTSTCWPGSGSLPRQMRSSSRCL
jgi:hypothetical protein